MRQRSVAGSLAEDAGHRHTRLPITPMPSSDTRQREALVTPRMLALLALILGIGVACRVLLITHSPAIIIPGDTASYMAPAASLVEHGTFTVGFKRPPVYPLFLAGIIALGGPSFEVAAAAQHVLGLVVVVLVYVLGALIFGRVAGLIAALGVAVSGPMLRMEHTVASETLFALLLLSSLLCVLLSARVLGVSAGAFPSRRTVALLLLTGVLVGLVALTRPTGQVMLGLVVVAVLLSQGAWRARLVAIGLLGLGYGFVMGPWLLRNYTAHGVATTAGGLGDSLYARISRHDPTFDVRDHGAPPADARRAEIRAVTFDLAATYPEYRGGQLRDVLMERLNLTEVESDEALKDAALVVIRQEPLRYLSGTVALFVRLGLDQGSEHPLKDEWETRANRGELGRYDREFRPRLEAKRPPAESRARVEQLLGFYRDRHIGVLVAALFLLGMVSCLRRSVGREAIVLPLVVVIHLLVYAALDGPHTRYRNPVQPLITLVAAGGLAWLASEAIGRVRARTVRRADGTVDGTEPEARAVPLGMSQT